MGMDRRLKPNVDLAPSNCPRCDSLNTKFCYYNNYSLKQPRYFCKTCRRYWTKGGSLRNVPIGGGCQKNSRGKRVTILTNHVSTRSSTYGGAPPGLDGSRLPPSEPVGSLNQSEGNSMVSSTEMTMVNPSTIDLALVYAKLLNHQPDSDPCLVMPEFPREFHASFDISSIVEPNHDSHVQLLQEHGLSGCQAPSDESKETQLSEVHQVLLDEFGMNHKQQELIPQFISLDTNGYRLQPFPTEEVVKDMFWSSPGRLSFGWQATQLQRFEPVPEYHSTLYSNSSSGIWSAFDLPSFEAFSMP